MGKYLGIIFLILAVGCSKNILNELADKNTDDALLFDARTYVNAQNYQAAIDIIMLQMSAGARAKTDAREVLASAYAGKCGLNFIDYTDRLAKASSGSAFVLVSSPFVGVAVNPPSCLQSLQTLDLIGTTATRNNRQNSFAAVVGMVLMGSAARFYTDNNPVNGDGIADAPNISCAITDPQIDNVILGYAYMSQNFAALSAATIGGSSSTTISGSIAVCSQFAGAACTNTDPAQISPAMRDTMRDLMNTSDYGFGTYHPANPALIPAACP